MSGVLRLFPLALLLVAGVAHADGERYGVIIGNNAGARGEARLRYAESDALRMYELLRGAGGFPAQNLLLVRGDDAESVRAAIVSVNEQIRHRPPAERNRAVLFVYYSGHGDADALHLGASLFAIRQLEQLVSSSPAQFRILVLDSCRSGTVTRVKGAQLAPRVQLRLPDQLAGEGMVLLTASAAGEDAQESDELQGSFFTHYLISGLLGAADGNGDGRVALHEAYEYVYQHTVLASSRTLVGTQHPTFRYDLRGKGDVPLTAVLSDERRALVRLPAGRDYLFVRDAPGGAVVAEVSARDARRELSLPAGRYFIRARADDHMLEGTVELHAGGRGLLSHDRLRRIAYDRLVRKGGSGRRLAHGPEAGIVWRTGLLEGQTSPASCAGLFVGYPLAARHLTILPRLSWCYEETEPVLPLQSSSIEERALSVRLGHAWDLPSVTVDLGVLAGVSWFRQRFAPGQRTTPARNSAGFTVGPGLALRADLPRGFGIGVDAVAHTYFLRVLTADPLPESFDHDEELRTRFALRASLGVSKFW